MQARHRVVIVGGGFGGLYAARALAQAPVEVLLLDRRNFHLFQPLLYQVATGGLSPANIAAPLRAVLKNQRNATVFLAEVRDFDLQRKVVLTVEGEVPFDSLIVASGSRHHYFGHPEWEAQAPGLKTVEDARAMRTRILGAFEAAEREVDPARIRALLTFVVVGGGPTGVELAGTVAELARHTLRRNFRRINPASASVVVLEAGDRLLAGFDPQLSSKGRKQLESLGVLVRTTTAVVGIEPGLVRVKHQGQEETIACHTILWGAGVQASPLAQRLAQQSGATLDRAGRIRPEPDLTLPGYPDVFVLGDMVHFLQEGQPLPGVAQVAMQMGCHAARTIERRLTGKSPLGAFVYRDPGSMATIGRARAIAQVGRWKLSGFLAWLAWLFVHILYLIQFENRILVMTQWAWNYFTRNRSARLITEVPPEK
ncbi:MAG: NAD(P)/FAD-dependent oxidoreductase [Gemmataceae bacterium]